REHGDPNHGGERRSGFILHRYSLVRAAGKRQRAWTSGRKSRFPAAASTPTARRKNGNLAGLQRPCSHGGTSRRMCAGRVGMTLVVTRVPPTAAPSATTRP